MEVKISIPGKRKTENIDGEEHSSKRNNSKRIPQKIISHDVGISTSYSSVEHEKTNLSDSDNDDMKYDLLNIVPLEIPKEDYYQGSTHLCIRCGTIIESGSKCTKKPKIHRTVHIKEAADYVLEKDFEFFMSNLGHFEDFIKERIAHFKGVKKCQKEALNRHMKIMDNLDEYLKSDSILLESLQKGIGEIFPHQRNKLEDSIKNANELYNKIGNSEERDFPKPQLPLTQTSVTNFRLLIDYVEKEKDNNKTISQQFKSKLPNIIIRPERLREEYKSVTDHDNTEKNVYKDPIIKVRKNLTDTGDTIKIFKNQKKYIKIAKEIQDREGINDDNIHILKSFAFTLLKYSSQLKDVEIMDNMTDSKDNYQMFYGSRYIDSVVSSFFFGFERISTDRAIGKPNHIPVCLSKACNCHINMCPKESMTLGGSADGYIAFFDNGRRKIFSIVNILTNETVILFNNPGWIQPIFWKKYLILFTTWDDKMILLKRDEFMENPNIDNGKIIEKDKILSLADNSDTQYTGKFSYATHNGELKIFDIETQEIVNNAQIKGCFSPILVYGKEKLFKNDADYKRYMDEQFFGCNLPLFTTTSSIYKNDPTGEPVKLLNVEDTTSTIILSNKDPENLNKALVFGWEKIYYGKQSSKRLCGIPIKPINMIIRVYSDVYFMANTSMERWESRRIMFEEELM